MKDNKVTIPVITFCLPLCLSLSLSFSLPPSPSVCLFLLISSLTSFRNGSLKLAPSSAQVAPPLPFFTNSWIRHWNFSTKITRYDTSILIPNPPSPIYPMSIPPIKHHRDTPPEPDRAWIKWVPRNLNACAWGNYESHFQYPYQLRAKLKHTLRPQWNREERVILLLSGLDQRGPLADNDTSSSLFILCYLCFWHLCLVKL